VHLSLQGSAKGYQVTVGYAGRGRSGGTLDGGSEDGSSDEGGDDEEDEVQSPRESRGGGGGGGGGVECSGRGGGTVALNPLEGGKTNRSQDGGQTLETEGGLECEDQDPFDFSASLARGREMSIMNVKKRLDTAGEDVEEEEEKEEEEEEEEEEKVDVIKSVPVMSQAREQSKYDLNTNLDDAKIGAKDEPSLSCPSTAAPEYQGRNVITATEHRTFSSRDVRATILKTRKRSLKSHSTEGGGGVGVGVGVESLPPRSKGSRDASEGGDEETQIPPPPRLPVPSQQPEVSLNPDPDWTEGRTLHRCLIFAQHRQTLDLIEKCVLQQHFPTVHYRKLDGTVPPAVRADVAHKFNTQDQGGAATLVGVGRDAAEGTIRDDEGGGGGRGGGGREGNGAILTSKMRARLSRRGDDIRILLMTTRSCGLGLNLTAADTVIL
jgi:hypothetical protein